MWGVFADLGAIALIAVAGVVLIELLAGERSRPQPASDTSAWGDVVPVPLELRRARKSGGRESEQSGRAVTSRGSHFHDGAVDNS
jgi:hypothetical protein